MSTIIQIHEHRLRLFCSGNLEREGELPSLDATEIENSLTGILEGSETIRNGRVSSVDVLLDRHFFLSVSRELPPRLELNQLAYELEEQVAVDAENMLIGFQTGRGERLVCIADRSKLNWLDRLSDFGLKLGRLMPFEVAAAVHAARKHSLADVAIAWKCSGRIDTFEMDSMRNLRSWNSNSTDLDFDLQRKIAGAKQSMVWISEGESAPDPTDFVQSIELSMEEAAHRHIANQSRTNSDFNLTQQLMGIPARPAQRPATMALVSATVVFACLGLFFQFASWQHSQQASTLKSEIATEFDDVFPGKERLRRRKGVDEATKVELRGLLQVREAADALGKQNRQVHEIWRRFVSELPSPNQGGKVSYRIQSVELKPERVVCQLELAKTKDPTWFANSMRAWNVKSQPVGGNIYRFEFEVSDAEDSKLDVAKR